MADGQIGRMAVAREAPRVPEPDPGAALKPLDPKTLIERSTLEIRGDGKAGGGLVLAFQSLAALVTSVDPDVHVQEWPFFSSARRGANIRTFLRLSRSPIREVCDITHPALVVLMDEAAAGTVDCAEGVPRGGTFVINSRRSPEECARRYRLSGHVLVVPGDDIGRTHLRHAIGNVSVYVAVAQAIGGFAIGNIVDSFLAALEKRHVPESVRERNRAALMASLEATASGVFDYAAAGDHAQPRFEGYGTLPVGAQTPLRLSLDNPTAGYAPSGIRLRFEDPDRKCTGCAHCITNCPEGIILFQPDSERGVLVTGADVASFCKLCGECIAVCPEHLFRHEPYEEPALIVEDP
jgi:2-oxoacid:acceptor oxidoreductase gamma subunit (pyruvate/2-ketoisovalerate family)